MDYFGTYRSNTLAGSGNQLFFIPDDPEKATRCRCFYRIFKGGRFNYSFLFSNTVDGTYSDGSFSYKNLVISGWKIKEMNAGVTAFCSENRFDMPEAMSPVCFSGERCKTVAPGELFYTDPVKLEGKSGEYICLEIVFSGAMIPNHEESIIPSFVFADGKWEPSKLHPFASMIGADLRVKKRIAFLGDSITQGIGTSINAYAHWNAVFADLLGKEYSYWNLGLGFGRADDAASDGVWLYKAKQNDVVFVCYGVNDILQGFSADKIKENIQRIVDLLRDAGVRVIVQTVPPFDYGEGIRLIWQDVNDFILHRLKNADFVFDCVACLGEKDSPHMAKYGGHPNEEGCRVWGKTLYEAVSSLDIFN